MDLQANFAQIFTEFPGLPPFPDDVPIAPLLRLSLAKLLSGDTAECERLYEASVEIGFFYLDLQDSEHGISLLGDADDLFGVGERLFELSLEEKKKYDFSTQNSYFGYKGQGVAVVDKQGNLDRNEFYNISKDDIMGITDTLPAPEILHENRSTTKSFMRGSHEIVILILKILNNKLNLREGTLQSLHRLQGISGDQVRFIKAPPQPVDDRRTALGQHTDFGSVTVLFNRLGGLQVLPPGADAEWVYVRPLPGHAIVNLGDAMVKFTNGLFRSNIHRVAAPPGIQGDWTRVTDNSPLEEGQEEEEINSKDWIIRRALGRRVDLVEDIDYEKAAGTEQMSRRIKV
ncbi:hypothetical protein N7462_004762 [Penicillium macrosclerotiorum]|uniref:uncharacterized protein n=1 Tax=Penicillium macrosclerotiorum TaxID=303699 RepID=UPI0025477641|nr:uncharacterized protein N7462_004762 [Penicillium macrosclerotiorum]KAJ5690370.1 hypothetical protein N7462_004762 [Penicillium macrosclerotiorum]